MTIALRFPFALLRPRTVVIPVRPEEPAATSPVRAADFPRRDVAPPALPALWEEACPAPRREPFGSRRVERRLAASWPTLAPIVGDSLPEPNVEPDDTDAWRVEPLPPVPAVSWGGHEPEEEPEDEVEPTPLVTDCHEVDDPQAPATLVEPRPQLLLPPGAPADPVTIRNPWNEAPPGLPVSSLPAPAVEPEPAHAADVPPPARAELVTDCYEPPAAPLPIDIPAQPVAAAAPEPATSVEPVTQPDAEPEVDSSLEVVSVPDEPTVEPAPVEPTPASPAEGASAPLPAVAAPPAPKVPLHRRELHLPRPRRRRDGHGRRGTDVVGLRVGSTQLAAARVHVNGGFELVQLARAPLAPGIVVGGEVRDPAALVAALKSFFAEHKLPRRNVRLGVASGRIGVRVLEVPPIDDARQLENAIRFRAHEEIPIPVAEAVLDHVVIGDGADAEGNAVRRILVAFAHRDLVLRQVEACRDAGLRPLGVDLDAFALLRAVTSAEDSAGGTRALVAVAVGHERTVLAVSDGNVCEFTRVLEWGGGVLDVALARALDLTPSEANQVKHRLSLAGDAPGAGLSPLQLEAAREAIRHELQNLAREIVSSLRYYQTRPGALDLGEIVLTGGASQLPGALAELEAAIGAPVRAGDPLARVTLGKKVTRPADAGSYAIAVGLGLDR